MNDQDHFSDVRGALGGYGVLGGDAADEVGKVTALPLTREGPQYKCYCQHCGQPNILTVNWQECAYVAQGVPPSNWVYDAQRGAIRPNVGCRMCNVLMLVLFTPDECARQLHAGEAAGYLPGGAGAQMRQSIAQAAAQYRR